MQTKNSRRRFFAGEEWENRGKIERKAGKTALPTGFGNAAFVRSSSVFVSRRSGRCRSRPIRIFRRLRKFRNFRDFRSFRALRSHRKNLRVRSPGIFPGRGAGDADGDGAFYPCFSVRRNRGKEVYPVCLFCRAPVLCRAFSARGEGRAGAAGAGEEARRFAMSVPASAGIRARRQPFCRKPSPGG